MADRLTLSTDDVPRADSASAWRDWMASLFFGLDSDLYGGTSFDGHLRSVHAGTVILTRLEADRHRVMRGNCSGTPGDSAYLKILAPWRGSAIVAQHARQARVRPGGWAIYDTGCRYEVINAERCEHLILMLPKALLLERGLRLEALMGREVGGADGITRVALEAMRNTFHELPHMSAEAARGAGDMIVELVRLSLMELAGCDTPRSQREAFRDRIRAYIGRHLRNPGLSIEGIAQAHHCSRRHLYNSFADEADTLSQYILRQRLHACMRDLCNPLLRERSITELAFSWGFGNMAHFSRVFRAHTGHSPSDYRHAAHQPS